MRGRSNRSAVKRAKLLEVVASGATLTAAARAAGMSWRSVYDWRAADPEFKRDLDDAYETATDKLNDHAWKRAFQSNNDALLIFLLKARDPARFNRKMLEARVVGDQNNPVTVEHQAAGQSEVQPGVRLVIMPRDDDRADRADRADRRDIEGEVVICDQREAAD
jgi:hypothetical protein